MEKKHVLLKTLLVFLFLIGLWKVESNTVYDSKTKKAPKLSTKSSFHLGTIGSKPNFQLSNSGLQNELIGSCRGGSSSHNDEDGEDRNTEIKINDINESNIIKITRKVFHLAARISINAALVVQRSLMAGFVTAFPKKTDLDANEDSDDDDNTKKTSFFKKVYMILGAMWKAAINVTQDDSSPLESEPKQHHDRSEKGALYEISSKSEHSIKNFDMGDFLRSSYGVEASSSSTEIPSAPILGGSISDALRSCRAQARLLLVFIPADKPHKAHGRSSRSSFDVICIQSLRSQLVAQTLASKKGSYVIWSARYGSPEAIQAIKRLRLLQGKKKLPTLVVAYPAQVLDKTGKIKILPKVLAQHHCNPPPTEASLASFLTALRKRHSSQIKTMRAQVREAELYAERKSNYQQSIESDALRKKKEIEAAEKQKAKIEKEKLHDQKIKERREKFIEFFKQQPEPPANEENVITVALRLADGRNGQRRFRPHDNMKTIFNWIDGFFEWDQDCLMVTTMRGDKKLEYKDCSEMTIGDYAGVSTNMLGLRISFKKEENDQNISNSTTEEKLA